MLGPCTIPPAPSVPHAQIVGIQFGLLSPDAIRKLAVAEVNKTAIYWRKLPVPGGVNDLAFGTTTRFQLCRTCHRDAHSAQSCQGHWGRIELAKPVPNMENGKIILKLLRAVCYYCSRCLIRPDNPKGQALEKLPAAQRLAGLSKLGKDVGVCCAPLPDGSPGCGRQPEYKRKGLEFTATFDDAEDRKTKFDCTKMYHILRFIPPDDVRRLGFDPEKSHPSWMVFVVLPVPPPCVRPAREHSEGDGARGQDDLTLKLKKIVVANEKLKAFMRERERVKNGLPAERSLKRTRDAGGGGGGSASPFGTAASSSLLSTTTTTTTTGSQVSGGGGGGGGGSAYSYRRNKLHMDDDQREEALYNDLRYEIATYINNEIPGVKQSTERNGQATQGIRQKIPTKKGRIRGNCLGKRTNRCARSVITPETSMHLARIGLPATIARVLTRDEMVQDYNVHRLTYAVRQGPQGLNGANMIIKPDGTRIDLKFVENRRVVLERGWLVQRHLIDGDPVILNRQPSLHRPSFMCCIVQIMPRQRTITLNMACCTPYNADFDGDEMTVHVLGCECARAECHGLMGVASHLLSAKHGQPVIFPIQNSPNALFCLTDPLCRLRYDHAVQLLWEASCWKGRLPPRVPEQPAGDKQQHPSSEGEEERHKSNNEGGQWTGSQVLSCLFPDDFTMVDEDFEVRQGWLIRGQLNRAQLIRLIRVLAKDHGNEFTADFISGLQVFLNAYLTQRGCSVGWEDCLNPAAEETKAMVDRTLQWVDQVDATDNARRDEVICSVLDTLNMQVGTRIYKRFDELARQCPSFQQGLLQIVRSGAKGNKLNIISILALVGQQFLQSRRIQAALPHYTPEEARRGAAIHGFVARSYAEGLNEEEYFNHSQGGRENLVDIAVKVSVTGYQERKMTKCMEDLVVQHDLSVRGSDGGIYQFLYGQDGFDATYVERSRLPSLSMDNTQLARTFQWPGATASPTLCREFERLVQERDTLRQWQLRASNNIRSSVPSVVPFERIVQRVQASRPGACGMEEEEEEEEEGQGKQEDKEEREKWAARRKRAEWVVEHVSAFEQYLERTQIVPLLWKDMPVNHTFMLLHDWFASRRVVCQYRWEAEDVTRALRLVEHHLRQGAVAPGESVGIIGAQSIGEPATQMTLNTFHQAGKASTTVQGVPRLKEITGAMGGDKLLTPYMIIPLVWTSTTPVAEDSQSLRQRAEAFAQSLPYVLLKDLSLAMHVKSFAPPHALERQGLAPFGMQFVLNKKKCIRKGLTPKRIGDAVLERGLRDSGAHYMEASAVNDEDWTCTVFLHQDSKDYAVEMRKYIKAGYGGIDPAFFYENLGMRLMKETAVRGCAGIKSANVREVALTRIVGNGALEASTEWVVETRGTNLKEILQFPQVDEARVSTNDIQSVAELFGIHAAAQWTDDQMQEVIRFGDASVDTRHTRLLADVMCFTGEVLPMNRFGVLNRKVSVLQRVSFEEAAEKLFQAGAYAQHDPLQGVTENTMVGNRTRIGSHLSSVHGAGGSPLSAIDVDGHPSPELLRRNVETIRKRVIEFPTLADLKAFHVEADEWLTSQLPHSNTLAASSSSSWSPSPPTNLSSFASASSISSSSSSSSSSLFMVPPGEGGAELDLTRLFSVVDSGPCRAHPTRLPTSSTPVTPKLKTEAPTAAERRPSSGIPPLNLRNCHNHPHCAQVCFTKYCSRCFAAKAEALQSRK